MFPVDMLHGFALPMLEDLFNHPFFLMFHNWCAERQINVAESHLLTGNKLQPSLGLQAAVLAQKRAVPSVISLHQSKSETFAACCSAAHEQHLPSDDMVCCADFSFAAWCTVHCMQSLRDRRKLGRALLKELSNRCQPLSTHLRKFVAPTVASVAGHMHVALMAAFVILMRWPDKQLPRAFLEGFKLIGRMDRVHIWSPSEEIPEIDEAALCRASPDVLRQYARRKFEHSDLAFLWNSCCSEARRGKAALPVEVSWLDADHGPGRWSVVPCFVHTQPCGKRRRIDDAKAGGQNSATAFSERFNMVSAMMPATAARLLLAWAKDLAKETALQKTALVTAGEDLPDAYRILPVHPRHLRHNNVIVKHPETWETRCWALLFGFAASVFQFERFSFFLEASGRRMLHLMISLFVDDSHLDELDVAGGHGQALWQELAAAFGQPFSPEKTHELSAKRLLGHLS